MLYRRAKAMTIQEFISKAGLTLEAKLINGVIDGKTPFEWEVKITNHNNESFTTKYTMGYGRVVNHNGRPMAWHKVKELLQRVHYQEMSRDFLRMRVKPEYPNLAELLECLQCDCSYVDSVPDFESYCKEHGLNSDSIRDRDIYDKQRNIHHRLRIFFGLRYFPDFLTMRDD
jgi:hypothetical protein